jgi:hypothetical protein
MNDDLEELKYSIGIDPASEDGDTSVVTIKTIKNCEGEADQYQWDDKGIPFDFSKFKWDKEAIKAWQTAAEAEEPTEQEHKKYWGKELNELTDEQLDNVVWGANLYPAEEREEILAEIKLRALKSGIALQEAAV